MIVLGLESSCDDTGVALVRQVTPTAPVEVLYHRRASQTNLHARFGGVVPELAARAHAEAFAPLLRQALAATGLTPAAIDAVAATTGPGLNGGLMVALMYAKSWCLAQDKPLYAINHLEGHVLMALLSEPALQLPYLMLLVSGGHCQLIAARGLGDYTLLGGTVDDAIGECFDKTARLLGLGFPGGPAIEALARQGNAQAVALPLPLLQQGLEFSFSGLKTAVRDYVLPRQPLSAAQTADLCASLQLTISRLLATKVQRALAQTGLTQVVLAGGVAANLYLRDQLTAAAAAQGAQLFAPPPADCTDNGLMIAYAGLRRAQAGVAPDPLNCNVRVRWPLAELSPAPATTTTQAGLADLTTGA